MNCVFCCRTYKHGINSSLDDILVQQTFEKFCVEILNMSQKKNIKLPSDYTLCNECLYLTGKAIVCDMEITDTEKKVEQLSAGMITEMSIIKRCMTYLLMDLNRMVRMINYSIVPPGENSDSMEEIRQEVLKVAQSLAHYNNTITLGLPRKVGAGFQSVFGETVQEDGAPLAMCSSMMDTFANTGFMCEECQTSFEFEHRLAAHLMKKENKLCRRKNDLAVWLDIIQKTSL